MLPRGGVLTINVIVNSNVKQIDITINNVKTTYTATTVILVEPGSRVSWTATANTGYTLNSSSGNLGEITTDQTISPVATIIQYTVTINVNANVASVTVNSTKYTSSTSKKFNYGTKITWSATANTNYIIDGSSSGTINSLTSNQTISPTTVRNYVWDGSDTVDLGLPSGTLWCTCNVKAASPDKYGMYYDWADTNGKTSGFSWSGTKYWGSGENTSSKYTKYTTNAAQSQSGTPDNITELVTSDDAAYVDSSGKYRTPTRTQYEELTNTSYTTKYWGVCNGIPGVIYVSKKNGKELFLPAAGYVFSFSNSVKSSGYYWSRTLYTSANYHAFGISITSSNTTMGGYYRANGFTIRGVKA